MAQQEASLTESKVKEMRRIPEKSEAPTDKTELIQYLNDRIKQAEDALTDTEQLLESEVKERQKISVKIEERNTQLQKLYAVDQKALPEKIKEKLTEILTSTVSQKVDAEQKRAEAKNKNYEYHQMYKELKWDQKNLGEKLKQQQSKEEALNTEIKGFEEKNSQHESELNELQTKFNEIKDKKQTLQNKYLQMKVALNRMGDIKAVLNRFFGNQDLFDEKMDLKEQKIQRIQVVSRQNVDRSENKESRNKTRLKPLAAKPVVQDDEDFWRGDFTKARY